MNENQANFVKWFKGPLDALYRNGDAGFIVLMTVLPLIERYLRQLSKSFEEKLNADFHEQFARIFDLKSPDVAQSFWQIYRNGLLHQATLSGADIKGRIMPPAYLSGDVKLITHDSVANIFYVHPEHFSRRVIEVIESDFKTYEAAGSPFHPLPQITQAAFSKGNLTGLSSMPPATGTP